MDRALEPVARDEIVTPLADAALAAGFSYQAYMTRRFKANFGLSPGQWQRLARPFAAPKNL